MTQTIAIIVATILIIAATLLPTYFMNKNHQVSSEEWRVADRSLPIYVVVGTQFASVIGGGVLVAHLGSAYKFGISYTIYGIMLAIPFFILMVLAKWMRKNQFSTIPEILDRFTNGNKVIKVIASIMTIIVPFSWVTSQITAFGAIYTTLTGMDYTMLCIIFAVISLLFVMPAGLKTVAWTDFIFACFMGVMCITCLIFAYNMGGGASNIVANLDDHMLSVSKSADAIGYSTIFLWIFAILPGGITNQLYFQRVCAIDDEKKVNKSLFYTALSCLIGFIWAVVMGIMIQSINPNIEGGAATGWFMTQLPLVLIAGFAALIFATMMSTVSSGVQSIVVNITRDIFSITCPDMDEKTNLKFSRAFSAITIAVALLMCLKFTDTLTWLVAGSALSAATLLCPIYVSYLMRDKNFVTSAGIGASMIAGAIGCLGAMVMETVINYAAIGIVFSFLALILVSMATRKKES